MHSKLFKKLAACICSAVMAVSLMATPVFANGNGGNGGGYTGNSQQSMGTSATLNLSVTDTAKADKAFADGTGLDGLTYGDGKLTWDGGIALSAKTQREQEKQVDTFFNRANSAGFSSEATNGMTNLLSECDGAATVNMSILLVNHVFDETKGDVVGGMRILDGFLPYINTIIGIGAILLISLLVLSTVIDLACIGLPAVRDAMLSAGDKEGGGGGGKKPKAITYAAWATISEVEGGESGKGSGKNAYLVYFKKRIFDYIILGIAISFLLIGGFSGFVKIFMEIGNGLIN